MCVQLYRRFRRCSACEGACSQPPYKRSSERYVAYIVNDGRDTQWLRAKTVRLVAREVCSPLLLHATISAMRVLLTLRRHLRPVR